MFGIQFRTRITLNTSWHIGTGLGQGLIDRTTQRDACGDVFIPASTIKGRLRNACEQVVRLYGSPDNSLRACDPPKPQSMCRGADCCIVCRIFGSVYQGERLYFENASLIPDLRQIYAPGHQSQPRTRIKLNRKRGIAEHGHLFTTEYAESSLIFTSRVSGKMSLTPFDGKPTRAYELILLAAGVRLVKAIGGNKSVGAGTCDIAFEGEIEVGDEAVSPAELFDLIEYLQFYGLD